MFQIRSSDARGSVDLGWLDSKHSFSFGDYHDPNHICFRNLRVLNEDKVLPKKGFGTHGHQDMEIISYIVSGSLQHKDSMNNGSILHSGDVQIMSAGTGIQHSEFNPSNDNLVHFLQIWILPEKRGLKPRYEERQVSTQKQNQLYLLVSGYSKDNALHINSPIRLYCSELDEEKVLQHTFLSDRHGWIQVVKGALQLSSTNEKLSIVAGDGIAISHLSVLQITALEKSEFLLFDLP
jgi:quercetin 2,3-dioxygenase